MRLPQWGTIFVPNFTIFSTISHGSVMPSGESRHGCDKLGAEPTTATNQLRAGMGTISKAFVPYSLLFTLYTQYTPPHTTYPTRTHTAHTHARSIHHPILPTQHMHTHDLPARCKSSPSLRRIQWLPYCPTRRKSTLVPQTDHGPGRHLTVHPSHNPHAETARKAEHRALNTSGECQDDGALRQA